MNRWQCLLAVLFAIANVLLQVNSIDDGQHQSRGKCNLYGPRRQCGVACAHQSDSQTLLVHFVKVVRVRVSCRRSSSHAISCLSLNAQSSSARRAGSENVSQAQCAHLGCCWFPLRPVSRTRRVEVPSCYTANGFDATYALSDLTEQGE